MDTPRPQDVTLLLERAGRGDSKASSELLPLVYEELRKLARSRMAGEGSGGHGQTLQPTALVHEAYMRLLGETQGGSEVKWDSRGHFFGAAAIAMRRILVERARARGRIKRGGDAGRVDLNVESLAEEPPGEELVALDDALAKLEKLDKRKHDVVMLRYFAGLSVDDTASSLSISPATAKNDWVFAKAWLKREMAEGAADSDEAGRP